MTIHEVSTQLYNLTGGKVNGERFSKTKLENAIKAWTRDLSTAKLHNRFVVELDLPDGKWLSTIDKDSKSGEYGYWIPENREQEAALWKRLTA